MGLQEVSVTGQDVVYKDIIEPLESVSVNMVATDKDDITLFGTPDEVGPLSYPSLPLYSPTASVCERVLSIWLCLFGLDPEISTFNTFNSIREFRLAKSRRR